MAVAEKENAKVSGIFDKMVEIENSREIAQSEKDVIKKRHEQDMAEAEKEHDRLVAEDEAEEKEKAKQEAEKK